LGGERSTAPACCAIGIRRVAPASATAASACAGESLSLRQAKSHRMGAVIWAENPALLLIHTDCNSSRGNAPDAFASALRRNCGHLSELWP
jgi:hypothetical protein